MKDISRSGMGAITDRWLYPGQKILLCLPIHPDSTRKNITATVIRCQKNNEGFRLGMEFDHVGVSSSVGVSHAVVAA